MEQSSHYRLDFRRFGKISTSFVFTRKVVQFKKFNQPRRIKKFSKTKKKKTQIPLIFLFENGTFYLLDVLDNKKLLAELKLKKTNAFPAYICIKNKEEYPSYLKNYGNPFHQAKIN